MRPVHVAVALAATTAAALAPTRWVRVVHPGQDEGHPAPRIHGTGAPPLPPTQRVSDFSFGPYHPGQPGLDVGRVRARHVRLGHEEGAPNPAGQ